MSVAVTSSQIAAHDSTQSKESHVSVKRVWSGFVFTGKELDRRAPNRHVKNILMQFPIRSTLKRRSIRQSPAPSSLWQVFVTTHALLIKEASKQAIKQNHSKKQSMRSVHLRRVEAPAMEARNKLISLFNINTCHVCQQNTRGKINRR